MTIEDSPELQTGRLKKLKLFESQVNNFARISESVKMCVGGGGSNKTLRLSGPLETQDPGPNISDPRTSTHLIA